MSNAIKNAMSRKRFRYGGLLVFYLFVGLAGVVLLALSVATGSQAMLHVSLGILAAFLFGMLVVVLLNAGSISVKPETAYPPRTRRGSGNTFSIPIDNDLAEDVLNSCTEQELVEAAACLRRASDRLAQSAEMLERRAKGEPG